MVVTSPDISSLEFDVLYDISGATPSITLTNQSTGNNLAGCTWWYDIITPSGTYIHQGNPTSPDKTGTWTTLTVPNTWPQPFGQIEWSGNSYIATLYVKDSNGNVFSVGHTANICRPLGSTTKTTGNWGVGSLNVITKCESAQLYTEDTTNYEYQGVFGTSNTQTITLVYPPSTDGTIPSPVTLTGFSSGLFDIQYDGEGYVVMMSATRSYALSEHVTVKIGYKTRNTFAVLCNIDLCVLACEIGKLADTINNNCGQNIDVTQNNKLLQINSLFSLALAAKQQPLCGINVADIVNQIIEIGGFSCTCLSGGTGTNGQIGGDINVTINGCGDINGTATVTGSNITLNLKDVKYIFQLCSGIPTTAFAITPTVDAGTCTTTYCFNVDLDQLKTDLNINIPSSTICVNVYEHGVSPNTPPAACPTSYFPVYVYNYANTTVIGHANDANELVSVINANSTWNTRGTAFAAGNCKVCFAPATGITAIDPIFVTLDTGSNPPSPSLYTVAVKNYCNDTLFQAQNTFPQNMYISYTNNGQRFSLGLINSYADLITAIAAETNKPSYITASATGNSDPNKIYVQIADSNTPANKIVNIYGERINTVLLGGNSHFGSPNANTDAISEIYPDTNNIIGSFCFSTYPGTGLHNNDWHVMKYGNTMLVANSLGGVSAYDITDPLNPISLGGDVLYGRTSAGSAISIPFSGNPGYGGGVRSDWDVYFPTDLNAQIGGNFTYIVESTSGTIYKFDLTSNTVAGAFFANQLLGMCPRVIYGNKLYLTRDGQRGSITGVDGSNPINANEIVIVDLSVFNASSILTVAIDPAPSQPWAMSVDPAVPNIAYITSVAGNVFKYDMSTDAVVTAYSGVTGSLAAANIVNTCIYAARLYISAYGIGTYQLALNTLGTSSANVFDPLPAVGGNNVNHFNFLGLPTACYGLVTFDNGTNDGGYAKYDLDGNFIGLVSFPGSIYNLLYVPNIITTTPNSLC